jgi:hypothetical protein
MIVHVPAEKREGLHLFSLEKEGVRASLSVEREVPLEDEERLLLSTLCKQLCIAHSGFKKRQESRSLPVE